MFITEKQCHQKQQVISWSDFYIEKKRVQGFLLIQPQYPASWIEAVSKSQYVNCSITRQLLVVSNVPLDSVLTKLVKTVEIVVFLSVHI